MPPSLVDIPLEVLIDNILPLLPLTSVAALAQASKDLAALCSDDTFWGRRLQEDYNFSDAATARTSGGYKILYRGFHRARLYVWGSTGEGRLGRPVRNITYGILGGSRPWPMRLQLPAQTRIVSLAPGGWSFHALDAQGNVYVWGQLNGEGMGLNADSFASPYKRVLSPLRLQFPEKITHISCGRAHAVALSAAHRVWVFTAWGSPCVLTAPMAAPRQVTCGWRFVAVLTHSGDVYLWWPFDGEFGERAQEVVTERENQEDREALPTEEENVIKCVPWDIDVAPKQIRDIETALPRLRGEYEGIGEKIVKIAAGDNFLIALTEGGHVLRADFPAGMENFSRELLRRPRWEYLPMFSEGQHVRSLPEFSSNKEGAPIVPDAMHITHISAHFQTFFAYTTGSSSIVLQGKRNMDAPPSETLPTVIPALQNRGVIAVVLGDYHFGALTASGKLLTWGQYSSGALGLGDPTRLPVGVPGGYTSDDMRITAQRYRRPPPDIDQLAEVKFGKHARTGGEGRKGFVFMAAAAGWHTGALVIDLEDDEEEEATDEETDDIPGWGRRYFPRGRLPFRIGLAGARGRGT